MRSSHFIAVLITTTFPALASDLEYTAKIAPLWQEYCIDCHASDDADGGFNMESFDAMMKGGENGIAIIPGNAQDSLLVKFLEGRSGKEGKNQFMPPGKREHLKAEEITQVRQWIDAGAKPPAVESKATDVLSALPKIKPTKTVPKAIHALAYSEQTKLLASGQYGRIELTNVAIPETTRVIEGLDGKINALVFSHDGQSLFAAAGVAGVNGTAYVFKVSDGTLIKKFEGHTDALYALTLSPDGKALATGGYDQRIRLWDIASGKETLTLTGHNGGIFGLAFRPDGKVLASVSADRTIKLWETATGKRLDTFSQPLKEQTTLAFHPGGKMLAAAGADSRIRIWNLSESAAEGSNKLQLTRFAHEGTVLSLLYSKDGKTLISTATDKNVKIWNADTMVERQTLTNQPDWVPALTMLDAQHVALGRLNGTLAVMNVDTAKPATIFAGLTLPKPELSVMRPAGIQTGTANKIVLYGKNLFRIQKVQAGHPGIQVTIDKADPKGISLTLTVTAAKDVPRSSQNLTVTGAGGISNTIKFLTDDLPQIVKEADDVITPVSLPLNVWGILRNTGQKDTFRFQGRKDEVITFDLNARRQASKATAPRLEVLDTNEHVLTSNIGLDSGADPFLAFTVPADGDYLIRVSETTLAGSPEHVYRLTAGTLAYVTGYWPLSVPAGKKSAIHLIGPNLAQPKVDVHAPDQGDVHLPQDTANYRSRIPLKIATSSVPEVLEQEPNNQAEQAAVLTLPVSVNGRLEADPQHPSQPDIDLYAFDLQKGQEVIFETLAGMVGSPADTKLEILDTKLMPVPMMKLQATKDSSITLRSEEANDPGIRLFQFDEMELDDYMYFNGEVTKIFRLPRGPDADVIYYSNGGKRRAYLNTSPAGHGLDEACYVVEPKKLDEPITPNGLPIFTLYYANDDDGERELGRDSRLHFTAPSQGRYYVRVTDTRGWNSERSSYRLTAQAPQQDFFVTLNTSKLTQVKSGAGEQFALIVDRKDGFDGDIRVDVANPPEGFYVSSPLVIQSGHLAANGSIFANPNLKQGKTDWSKTTLTATATVNGKEIRKNINPFPDLMVTAPSKQAIYLEPDTDGKPAGDGKSAPETPYEITITPGETALAWVRVDRKDDGNGFINVDVDNLPHGIILANLGLNGAQIRPNEQDRQIEISCSSWVEEQDRLIHAIIGSARDTSVRDSGQSTMPILLKVRKPKPIAAGQP